MKSAIVFGANSTIAKSVVYQLARDGFNLQLLARDTNQLTLLRQDLLVKYPNLKILIDQYDAESCVEEVLSANIEYSFEQLGVIDLVLIAHGNLPDQTGGIKSWGSTKKALQVNGLSVLEICHKMSLKLKEQKSGTIAVISSVAGLRGRQSNYIYGTAKGMINIYLQGLRNDMYAHGVHVLTILPGFVDTKMTAEFKKGALWAKPDKVAKDIVTAIYKKKDILYTPWFWCFIMLIILHIPERIFKRMKL
jgi:decaprenylphospho-beta-D-erythro-pentofuranosid-2-ulose 2-reductase